MVTIAPRSRLSDPVTCSHPSNTRGVALVPATFTQQKLAIACLRCGLLLGYANGDI